MRVRELRWRRGTRFLVRWRGCCRSWCNLLELGWIEEGGEGNVPSGRGVQWWTYVVLDASDFSTVKVSLYIITSLRANIEDCAAATASKAGMNLRYAILDLTAEDKKKIGN